MEKEKDKKDESKGNNPLSTTSIDEIKGTKSKSKKNKFTKKKHARRNSNDPSWYVANQAIVKDIASLPFAVYNGVTYRQFAKSDQVALAVDTNTQTHVPGVMVYKYMPWYGTAKPTSALNLTMRALYSFVRHANSGRSNYEAPDLMLYIMAMDNIYLVIHELKRLLRLSYHYSLENRDIPNRVFDALGVNGEDLISNLANYRAELNTRIAKANSLAVPANFNLFKRRAVMGSVVLTDEPNRPTQLIVPQADGYYIYDPTGSTGGQLKYIPSGIQVWEEKTKANDMLYTAPKVRFTSLLRVLDKMLSVLLSDEDINIMSGDIIKAYGSDLYTLPLLGDSEIQEIIHDENLLLQFSNSTVLDVPGATFAPRGKSGGDYTSPTNLFNFKDNTLEGYINTPIITQRSGSLIAELGYFRKDLFQYVGQPVSILNNLPLTILETQFLDTTESNSISPENIMEWSRLMMTINYDNTLQLRPGDYSGTTKAYVEAGVEIGLGWLVSCPITRFKINGGVIGSTYGVPSITSQWFQFARPTHHNKKIDLGIAEIHPNVAYLHYTMESALDNITDGMYAKKYNDVYVAKAIEGLTFGPRPYWLNEIYINEPGKEAVISIDGAIAKLYEKTALVSKYNIVQMHDAALLGLISSPYIKNSK